MPFFYVYSEKNKKNKKNKKNRLWYEIKVCGVKDKNLKIVGKISITCLEKLEYVCYNIMNVKI